MIQRFLLLLLITSLSITKSLSQNRTSLGVKVGVNFTGFHTGTSTYTGEFGLNAGLIVDHKISNFLSIQPELIFNEKAGNYTIPGNEMVIRATSKVKYIDIPIMAKINILESINFQLGPQVGFLVAEKTEYNSDVVETTPKVLDLALNGGFGYQIKRNIFLQARYSYGVKEIFENENYKNSVISLSIGYKFQN
ncbi:outer membrane protein with beta-barrel domain [Gramella sp. Hel_I_59]|uniref:porin family protein n=1 Tax=Gramella sp. Hel_I_59 TaxID=1249978 RepID=UPI001152B06C|nr:porin family protein [Gramella sp. Hel_I_59]TQI71162.1 outer membrane protein with beta-barrel domain [Gramella sp. Hel_I_59]